MLEKLIDHANKAEIKIIKDLNKRHTRFNIDALRNIFTKAGFSEKEKDVFYYYNPNKIKSLEKN